MPEIQVVDVKDLRRRKMMSGPFSPQLLAHLQLIQSQIDWEMKQMQRIIRDKDAEGIPYTIDDIAKEIQQLPPCQSVLPSSGSR